MQHERLAAVGYDYDAAYAAFDNQAKERHLFDEYPSVRGKTLFLPKDRLYLTKRIIDEVFDFGVLKEKDVVGGLHALHDANSRTYFQFVASARWLGLRLDLVRVRVSSP